MNDTLENLKKVMDNDGWYDSIFSDGIPNIKNQLTEKYSIRPEDILLFCYGHGVEKFIEPFMKKLIAILKDSKIEEVRNELNEASNKDINNTISRIENMAKQDIKTKLNDSFKSLVYGNVENKQMQIIKEKLAKELKGTKSYLST